MTLLVSALWSVVALLALPLLALVTRRWPATTLLIYGACLAICVLLFVAAVTYLVGDDAAASLWLPIGLPWTGANFRVDALAAFFLAVINLGGAGASLFALGYGRHEKTPGRVLPFYPAFLAGMNLVVLADDAFSFLVSWEFMSLSSWALVMAYHQNPENRRAGYVYIVMASFGTLCLLLAFGLLAGSSGGYAFGDMRAATPAHPGLVLLLVLLGAGSKAGLVPLHVWLPLAHPAAPSHVSALMSGVMTKVAVYGFIRIIFSLNGPLSWWWGVLVIPVAGITCLLGVLSALMQHDLKRLLAYHTVENIGIIFIGIGLALAFSANNMPGPAALALTAALFHVFNHSLFKSLLFFGSGAVLTSTGERDMEHLGGLIHRMPLTAFAFLVGCVAISALPPLNGFVSEWLTFQAILLSPDVPSWGIKLIVPAVGAMLALSAALAAACFVKAFGVTFLGRPRSPAAARAHETDRASLAAMFILAALCLAAGILPGFVIDGIGARGGEPGRRSHARAELHSVAVDRAGGREPQLLRRSPGLRLHRDIGAGHGGDHPSLRLAPPAARLLPGTAVFPTRARRPNTPPAASPSRSAASSGMSCSSRASTSRCRPPATSRRLASASPSTTSCGTGSTPRSPMPCRSPPASSPICSS